MTRQIKNKYLSKKALEVVNAYKDYYFQHHDFCFRAINAKKTGYITIVTDYLHLIINKDFLNIIDSKNGKNYCWCSISLKDATTKEIIEYLDYLHKLMIK